MLGELRAADWRKRGGGRGAQGGRCQRVGGLTGGGKEGGGAARALSADLGEGLEQMIKQASTQRLVHARAAQ